MKALIAQFKQETNTFSPFLCYLTEKNIASHMNEDASLVLTREKDELKAFLDTLLCSGADERLSTAVHLGEGGMVFSDCYENIADKIVSDIKTYHPEIVLLALHGAMVAEGHSDASGELLRRCREETSGDCIIGATMDLHANITPVMIENADYLCC